MLYYQLTLYDMLQQTGILENLGPDSPISEEKCLALQEIIELKKERIRLDEEQDRTFIEPNEKKKIERLGKFVKDFDEVLRAVDFRSIFSHYQRVVQAKVRSVERVTKELMKIGMLNDPDAAKKTSTLNQVEHVKDSMMMTVRNLTAQEENDEFEQKLIKVDGAQLKSLQKQFDMLNKPVTQGMTDFILEQEKMEAELEIESSGRDSDDDDLSSDSSHSSYRSSKQSSTVHAPNESKKLSRRASISNKKQQYGFDLGEFERKSRANDKQSKNALMSKLQEKQAQR